LKATPKPSNFKKNDDAHLDFNRLFTACGCGVEQFPRSKGSTSAWSEELSYFIQRKAPGKNAHKKIKSS
jgi:hypothetical protein